MSKEDELSIQQENELKQLINSNHKHADLSRCNKTVSICFKVSQDDEELLIELSKQRGISMSKLIRYCLMSEGAIYSFD